MNERPAAATDDPAPSRPGWALRAGRGASTRRSETPAARRRTNACASRASRRWRARAKRAWRRRAVGGGGRLGVGRAAAGRASCPGCSGRRPCCRCCCWWPAWSLIEQWSTRERVLAAAEIDAAVAVRRPAARGLQRPRLRRVPARPRRSREPMLRRCWRCPASVGLLAPADWRPRRLAGAEPPAWDVADAGPASRRWRRCSATGPRIDAQPAGRSGSRWPRASRPARRRTPAPAGAHDRVGAPDAGRARTRRACSSRRRGNCRPTRSRPAGRPTRRLTEEAAQSAGAARRKPARAPPAPTAARVAQSAPTTARPRTTSSCRARRRRARPVSPVGGAGAARRHHDHRDHAGRAAAAPPARPAQDRRHTGLRRPGHAAAQARAAGRGRARGAGQRARPAADDRAAAVTPGALVTPGLAPPPGLLRLRRRAAVRRGHDRRA